MLPDNQRLLEAYGYHMRNLDEMLKRLAQRVRQISSRKLGFPHEIGGVFRVSEGRCGRIYSQ